MKFEYLIIGSGLAGLMLCETLRKRDISFKVISNNSQTASIVASGLYNPVVLKRFNKAWNAQKQLPYAILAYNELEKLLKIKIDHKLPIFRVFNSIEEQNDWIVASDNLELDSFLDSEIKYLDNPNIIAQHGYGKVNNTGRVDTKLLLNAYKKYLISRDLYIEEPFDHKILNISPQLSYKNILANKIIFAEGFGLKRNPLFNYLPLQGTKGELVIIRAPDLNLNVILKSSIFIVPLGDNNYLVGSTYAWDDYSNLSTNKAKNELLEKLEKLISCPYEVVYQRAGIRPTVTDRRPLVGQHKSYKNLYVLNGLGSRGVLIAPNMAKELIEFIEEGTTLNQEINISRFNS